MSEKTMASHYQVSPLTMAVLAECDSYGNVNSRIIETNKELIVQKTPTNIIAYACEFFGSTLKGRQDGTRIISGYTHKVPITIDPYNGIYFFPTSSPREATCSWISHTHIHILNDLGTEGTEISFENNKRIVVDVAYGSMKNQLFRTAQFRYLLSSRITNQRPDQKPFL